MSSDEVIGMIRKNGNGEYERIVKRGLKRRECEAIGGLYQRVGKEDLCFIDVKAEGDELKVRKPSVKIEDVLGEVSEFD